MNTHKILALFFLSLCFSCKNPNATESTDANIKTVVIPDVQAAEKVNIIDSLGCIVLEDVENAYFGYVTKMRVFQDKIYTKMSLSQPSLISSILAGSAVPRW